MTVKYIREAENGARMRIGIEANGAVEPYTVSARLYGSLGIVRGMELSEEMLSEIVYEDEHYRAFKRALNILSYADNTASNLVMKLRRAGFGREVAEECAKECLCLGYIDEERQIARAVLSEANRALHGRAYIIRKLRSKGYKRGMIESVIDSLVRDGEIDFVANFEKLAEKSGAITDEERRRLAYKRGYRGGDLD